MTTSTRVPASLCAIDSSRGVQASLCASVSSRRVPASLCAAVVVAAACCALAAGAARAERFAVLPVDAERNGGPLAVEAAGAMRDALKKQGFDVLSIDATRSVLVEQTQIDRTTSIEKYRELREQAEAALAALDENKSLERLGNLIDYLARDPVFSAEKQAMLEQARLARAVRLLGLAGSKETGKGETERGRDARELLVDAVRANPSLNVSVDEYPPRFHALLASARAELEQKGRGGLIVDSTPQGAEVFVEGRSVGRTPLTLPGDALYTGTYRVWVESGGARSVPKTMATGERIRIDLAFEAALWPEGPGLRPIAGNSIDEDVAKRIGQFLGVDTLLLVGKARYDTDNDWLWGAAFSVAPGTTARRGAVRLGPEVSVAAAAATLADFLGRGERPENSVATVEDKPLPPSVLPMKKSVAASANGPILSVTSPGAPGDIPWVPIGIAAGGVVVVGAVTAVVIALVAAQPVPGAVTFKVERL